MNRSDFIKLAELRLHEAKVLLDAEKFDGAYYLCGYIVECALKACIAKKTKEFDLPDLKQVKKSYTHDLENLMESSGLKSDFDKEIKTDTVFRDYWSTIKDWDENSRYKCVSQQSARDLYMAIADETKGVLK